MRAITFAKPVVLVCMLSFLFVCPGVSRCQTAPPAYFDVSGSIGNGDYFDPGFHFDMTSTAGGGTSTRPFLYGGSGTVTASLGAASASVIVDAILPVVHLNRHCSFAYGCHNDVAGSVNGAIKVYVRGGPGTKFHIEFSR